MAKIRNGFVSNSSSSSFVVAIRKNVIKEDIETYFSEEKELLESFISITEDYYSDSVEYDEMISLLANKIMETKNGLLLNDWYVGSFIFGNEDYIDEGYLYEHGDIDTDFFKMKATD